MSTERAVNIVLMVKAGSAEEAKEVVSRRLGPTLNVWFTEDTDKYPKPAGSLLLYNVSTIEPVKNEPAPPVDDSE
jgi:hypothetical protein